MCAALTEGIWDDMNTLITEELESNPTVREFVDALSDEENQDP